MDEDEIEFEKWNKLCSEIWQLISEKNSRTVAFALTDVLSQVIVKQDNSEACLKSILKALPESYKFYKEKQ